MQEPPIRILAKTISWRIISAIIILLTSYLVTHRIHTSIELGLINVLGSAIAYYIYERIWASHDWAVISKGRLELRKRSLAKTILWHSSALIITLLASYFLTTNFHTALTVATVSTAFGILLGYAHERFWNII